MQFGLSVYFKKNNNIYYYDKELIDNEDFSTRVNKNTDYSLKSRSSKDLFKKQKLQ